MAKYWGLPHGSSSAGKRKKVTRGGEDEEPIHLVWIKKKRATREMGGHQKVGEREPAKLEECVAKKKFAKKGGQKTP